MGPRLSIEEKYNKDWRDGLEVKSIGRSSTGLEFNS